MNFVNTLTVNGQTFTVQDPNAVQAQQLEEVVRCDEQTLTEAQKAQARANIGIKDIEIANALKGALSGAAVSANDVSPIEHKLAVQLSSDTITDFSPVIVRRYGKNLLTLANRQEAHFGVFSTPQRNFTENSFYYRISATNYYGNDTTGYRVLGDNSVEISIVNAYGFGVNMRVKPGETYTASAKCQKVGDAYGSILAAFYDINGNYLSYSGQSTSPVKTFTVPNGCAWAVVIFASFGSNGTGDKLTFTDMQIEIGNLATDFEPYNGLQTVTANADGTVEGVTSLFPTFTLLPDKEEVNIICEYSKDTNKVIGNLVQAIISLGGNI